MTEYSEHLLTTAPRRKSILRFRMLVIVVVPLVAVLFRVYVSRFVPALAYLDLALLVTVYFSLMQRSPIAGVFIGSSIGLVQDSLSHEPVGMFGIVKTLVGYFAASVGQKFDVENQVIRMLLGFFFFFFHQFFYWVMLRALLGKPAPFLIEQTLMFGLLNSAVAVPLFFVLDKLKE